MSDFKPGELIDVNCGRGCSQWAADAACPEHGVAAYLRGLLDAPAVASDPEDPNAPKAGA